MKKVVIISSVFLIGVLVILAFVFFNFESGEEGGEENVSLEDNETRPENETVRNESMNECVRLGCPDNTKYVGSRESNKFYRCECPWGKNIKEENLLCFESDQEALDLNYTRNEC